MGLKSLWSHRRQLHSRARSSICLGGVGRAAQDILAHEVQDGDTASIAVDMQNPSDPHSHPDGTAGLGPNPVMMFDDMELDDLQLEELDQLSIFFPRVRVCRLRGSSTRGLAYAIGNLPHRLIVYDD